MFSLEKLSAKELLTLIDRARALLYPEARFRKGQMVCRKCRRWSVPVLVETGYVVTHNLQSVNINEIIASGWDGKDTERHVSEDGYLYLLECGHCEEPHRIPAAMWIKWVPGDSPLSSTVTPK